MPTIKAQLLILLAALGYTAAQSCVDPGTIQNGNRNLTGQNINNTVTYTCSSGYEMHDGSDTYVRQCEAATPIPVWSGSIPNCDKINCPDPGDADNSDRSGTFEYNDIVTYTCHTGHRTDDNTMTERLTCLQTKLWDKTKKDCHRVQCIEPEDMPFSNHTVGPFFYGDIVTYDCFEGYNMTRGEVNLTCSHNTFWTGTYPTCDKVSCGDPGRPAGTRRTMSGVKYHDMVTYTCRLGYTPESAPEVNRTCQADATWNGLVPVCVGLRCPDPQIVEWATISNSTYRHPETITYTCNVGYTKVYSGSSDGDMLNCKNDATWDRTPISCTKVRCWEPGNSVNTKFNNNQYFYDETKVYECRDGYELISGQLQRNCQANAAFEGDAPNCQKKLCGDPGLADHSTRNGTGGFLYHDVLVYDCSRGYEIEGEENRVRRTLVCSALGEWSRPVPTCTRVNCGEPRVGAAVVEDLREGTLYLDTVQYSCSYGYELYQLTGPTMAKRCQSNRAWSGATPNCVRRACPDPGEVPHTKRLGLVWRYGQKVSYLCVLGYERVAGNESIHCGPDGEWHSTRPTCQRVKCRLAETVANSVRTPASEDTVFIYEDEITYTCEDGYEWLNSSGPLTRQCESTRQWSGKRPICDNKSCGDPGEVVGTFKIGSSFKFLDTVNYTCRPGHVATGSPRAWSIIRCEADQTWVGSKPVCERMYCGHPGFTNATLQSTNDTDFYYLDRVHFSCISDYMIHGRYVSIICTEMGTWNLPVPNCTLIPDLPVTSDTVPDKSSSEAEGAAKTGMLGMGLLMGLGCMALILDISTAARDIKMLKTNLTHAVRNAKELYRKIKKTPPPKKKTIRVKKIKSPRVAQTPVQDFSSV